MSPPPTWTEDMADSLMWFAVAIGVLAGAVAHAGPGRFGVGLLFGLFAVKTVIAYRRAFPRRAGEQP